eukprot:SAG11_NODE_12447_length_703_cov_0.773179_1_plen_234_part_11
MQPGRRKRVLADAKPHGRLGRATPLANRAVRCGRDRACGGGRGQLLDVLPALGSARGLAILDVAGRAGQQRLPWAHVLGGGAASQALAHLCPAPFRPADRSHPDRASAAVQDLATWQYPALAPLYPRLGASLLLYRERRLGAAKTFARATGHAGARFPWESGQSGLNVCGWSTGALYEQHITGDCHPQKPLLRELRQTYRLAYLCHTAGDVAMAFRQQYYLTRDTKWLAAHGWP